MPELLHYGALQLLFVITRSSIVHRSTPTGDCIEAFPLIVVIDQFALTLRSGGVWFNANKHDPGVLVIVAVPVKIILPHWNRYWPVKLFISSLELGFPSSSRQMLKTVTLNVHVVRLPRASVALHVTVVVPTGKLDPGGGKQVAGAPAQLSVAGGAV
jgi:hypothetical protein